MSALDPQRRMTVRDVADLVGAMAPRSPTRLRHQQLLRDALRQRLQVEIEYQSTSDPLHGLTRRKIDVWALRLPWIQGFCHLRDAERVFRVERIRSVRLLSGGYTLPDDLKVRV
ncbi:MAG TPA: WYL domain-containing protein [Deltaproteobacteria bacterium]|nr:WYL domain-containing protein [Deltaproteobacteria bacterium]